MKGDLILGLFDKFRADKIISPSERREKNNKFIKSMGISCLEELPLTESSNDVKLKDIDSICKRSIACLLSIQLACDICGEADVEESKSVILSLLDKFQVSDALLDIEKRLITDDYSKQDAIDVAWTYECYWSLIWALGLIDDNDIKIPSEVCDCNKAIDTVASCKDYDEFKVKVKIRNIENILDMLDLYYRYHWACVDKSVNPKSNIGSLNPEVVMERRRGLEWLVSKADDWNDISLDT